MTYLYMTQSDTNKYGTLIKGLKSQYSLNNDQYPRNLERGNRVLSSHKWDDEYKEHVKKQKQKNNNKSDMRNSSTCVSEKLTRTMINRKEWRKRTLF